MNLTAEPMAAKAQESAPRHGPTPLYADPREGKRTLRLVLVVPSRIPAWIDSLLQLVADNPWLEVIIIPVADAMSRQRVEIPFDLRVFLALERLLVNPVVSLIRRNNATPLSRVPLVAHPGVRVEPELRHGEGSRELRGQLAKLTPDLVLLQALVNGRRPWRMPPRGAAGPWTAVSLMTGMPACRCLLPFWPARKPRR